MLIRTLATVLTATLLTLVLALFLAGEASAGSWKDKRGHGKWHGDGYHAQESHWRGHGKHRHGHWKHAHRQGHWKRAYRHGHRHHHHGHHHYAPVDITWLFGPAFSHVMPGEALVWQDPAYRDPYQVVPTRDYRTAQGRYCREYQATATVGGRLQQTYGTACLQPDGAWRIVSQN